MSKDEALKMAIEFIHKTQFESGGNYYVNRDKTIQACKEALEQPTNMVTIPLDKLEDMQRKLKEQPTKEPMIIKQDNGMVLKLGYDDLPNGTPFYTHPKEWQGLSDDEILDIKVKAGLGNWYDFSRAIEQSLKEKNI